MPGSVEEWLKEFEKNAVAQASTMHKPPVTMVKMRDLLTLLKLIRVQREALEKFRQWDENDLDEIARQALAYDPRCASDCAGILPDGELCHIHHPRKEG